MRTDHRTGLELAGPGRRTAALAIDTVLVASGAGAGWLLGSPPLAAIIAIELALLWWGFMVRCGASPGQALTRTRVIDAGRPWTMGLRRGLIRAAVTAAGTAGAVIGAWLLAALVSHDGVGLDDRLSSTRTVVLPARRQAPRVGPCVPDAGARLSLAALPAATLSTDTGQSFALAVPGHYVVGRGPIEGETGAAAALVIVDLAQSVSRVHMRLDCESHGLVVTDLGSTNGTAISERGTWRPLEPHHPVVVPWGSYIAAGDRVLRAERATP